LPQMEEMAGSKRHCRENPFIDPVGARKLSALLHRTRTANASPSEMTGETDHFANNRTRPR